MSQADSSSSSSPFPDVLVALEKTLNQQLQGQSVRVQVGRGREDLRIFVEGYALPDRQRWAPRLYKALIQVGLQNLSDIQVIQIFGRTVDQVLPAWQVQLTPEQQRVLLPTARVEAQTSTAQPVSSPKTSHPSRQQRKLTKQVLFASPWLKWGLVAIAVMVSMSVFSLMPSLLSRSHHSPPVSDQDRRSGHAYALRFDGDDHIAIAAVQDLSEISYPTMRLTLSCWIYPTSINNAGRILERSDNDTDDRIVFALDERNQGIQLNINGTIATAPNLPLNRWSHVAGTYDGEKIRLYINGEFQTEVPYAGMIDFTEADLWLGNNLAGNRSFTGDLNEVQIWYRTLSARDIQNSMAVPYVSDT